MNSVWSEFNTGLCISCQTILATLAVSAYRRWWRVNKRVCPQPSLSTISQPWAWLIYLRLGLNAQGMVVLAVFQSRSERRFELTFSLLKGQGHWPIHVVHLLPWLTGRIYIYVYICTHTQTKNWRTSSKFGTSGNRSRRKQEVILKKSIINVSRFSLLMAEFVPWYEKKISIFYRVSLQPSA